MAQPSVLNYFNNRKRPAHQDSKINVARKVLMLDSKESICLPQSDGTDRMVRLVESQTIVKSTRSTREVKSTKRSATPKAKKSKPIVNTGHIETFVCNMGKNSVTVPNPEVRELDSPKETISTFELPKTPTKSTNALDKLKLTGNEPTLSELKQKLSRSSRLAELKASISRFKECEKKLAAAEEKTVALKNFKSIELEVNVSPSKPQSPLKSYLSPKKDTSSVCRNLFNAQSPTKAVLEPSSPSKTISSATSCLTLPYKYRKIAEIFRSIDTICQIMYNRKESITFKKLKPSVEVMLKQNLNEHHLEQIKHLYPEAFTFHQEKLREFGTGTRKEAWELILLPKLDEPTMKPSALLERRRKLFSILMEKVKDYHDEFLMTLDPPMKVERDNIKRWHPLFDIEKVPDIERSPLPQPPRDEELTTGSQVLEKARALFNCKTRLERALENYQGSPTIQPEVREESVLKGIPKALLEKVRQRQAAKALQLMTRSVDKEKEIQLYTRLPEIARLIRNIFVTDKKNVMPIEALTEKLWSSASSIITKSDVEASIQAIAKEEKEWMTVETVRGSTYVRIMKYQDINLIMGRLQKLADQKKT
uniref:CDT1 Geminin-binding domain-containing protein n=1 Tax=Photinus pyralis TaxID=7054 RepID=A0A1Y1L6K2_PHOPY